MRKRQRKRLNRRAQMRLEMPRKRAVRLVIRRRMTNRRLRELVATSVTACNGSRWSWIPARPEKSPFAMNIARRWYVWESSRGRFRDRTSSTVEKRPRASSQSIVRNHEPREGDGGQGDGEMRIEAKTSPPLRVSPSPHPFSPSVQLCVIELPVSTIVGHYLEHVVFRFTKTNFG